MTKKCVKKALGVKGLITSYIRCYKFGIFFWYSTFKIKFARKQEMMYNKMLSFVKNIDVNKVF